MTGDRASGTAQFTVVVVEADTENRQLIMRVLETTGRYHVLGAKDGHGGLELIQEHVPDLVLCELDLPVVNGFELFRRIRSDPHLDKVPVIAVSGAVMKGERRRCLDMGFAAFVEKPFDIHELRSVIARCTDSTATRRDETPA